MSTKTLARVCGWSAAISILFALASIIAEAPVVLPCALLAASVVLSMVETRLHARLWNKKLGAAIDRHIARGRDHGE